MLFIDIKYATVYPFKFMISGPWYKYFGTILLFYANIIANVFLFSSYIELFIQKCSDGIIPY